jgi:hypothetical protein
MERKVDIPFLSLFSPLPAERGQTYRNGITAKVLLAHFVFKVKHVSNKLLITTRTKHFSILLCKYITNKALIKKFLVLLQAEKF